MTFELHVQKRIGEIVARCGEGFGWLEPICEALLEVCLHDLVAVEEALINPVAHHFVVARNVAEVFGHEFARDDTMMKQGITLAFGHDSSGEQKVTSQDSAGPSSDEQQRKEFWRFLSRLTHMCQGAENLTRYMLKVNQKLGFDTYSTDDLIQVVFAAAQHDRLSVRKRISRSSAFLWCFCQCDLLWMVHPIPEDGDETPYGPQADLWRKGKDYRDKGLLKEQLKQNLESVMLRLAWLEGADPGNIRHCLPCNAAHQMYTRHIRVWESYFNESIEELIKSR